MHSDDAPSPRVRRVRIIRLVLHLGLLLCSLALLAVAASVLAYSIRVYYGSYLHAVPELLGSGGLTALIVLLAWLPRGGGEYGIRWMACVGGEVAWTTFVCLLTLGSVTSLHQSTPGLLAHCGPYFICSGYIAIFVLGWLCWLISTMCLALLLSSALYQRYQRHRLDIWHQNVTREWDFFWPDEAFAFAAASSTSRAGHTMHAGHGIHGVPHHDLTFYQFHGGDSTRSSRVASTPPSLPHTERYPQPDIDAMAPRSTYVSKQRHDLTLPTEHVAPGGGLTPALSSSPDLHHDWSIPLDSKTGSEKY